MSYKCFVCAFLALHLESLIFSIFCNLSYYFLSLLSHKLSAILPYREIAPNYNNHICCHIGKLQASINVRAYALYAIWAIAYIWFSSCSMHFGIGCWGISHETCQLHTFCPKQAWVYEYHTFIKCFSIIYIRLCFLHIFDEPNPCVNFSYSHNVHS